jgi:hypothetical protein
MATKVPSTETLPPCYEALEDARQGFVDACYALQGTLDLTRVTTTLAAWQQAAEAFNTALEHTAVDVRSFIEDHSERWIESDRGQAFEQWAEALEEAQLSTEPVEPLRLSVDLASTPPSLTVDNPEDVLPETPEIPELDWQ